MKTEKGYRERYFIAFFVHGINGKIEIVQTLKFAPLNVSKIYNKHQYQIVETFILAYCDPGI